MTELFGEIIPITIHDNFIYNFMPCYAMTVHKSQGLTIKCAHTLWQVAEVSDDSRKCYTSISRTKYKHHLKLAPTSLSNSIIFHWDKFKNTE